VNCRKQKGVQRGGEHHRTPLSGGSHSNEIAAEPRFRVATPFGERPMKVVFSRKGFDSSAGGVPSPIIDGRPITLPIPTQRRSVTTYGDLGLGDIVEHVTKGKLTRKTFCHHDPMFEGGHCAFGQTGAAQAHLCKNGVAVGDVFLFFGLFADADGRDRHHRIFGYLEVESVNVVGTTPDQNDQPRGFSNRHPHTIGEWNRNNTIYAGPGRLAATSPPALRLSIPGEQVSRWRVPPWLRAAGLTYHRQPERWELEEKLNVASRGQEFIADTSNTPDAAVWLDGVKAAIAGGAHDHE
jgi:Nucleotide modification associated domain 3